MKEIRFPLKSPIHHYIRNEQIVQINDNRCRRSFLSFMLFMFTDVKLCLHFRVHWGNNENENNTNNIK